MQWGLQGYVGKEELVSKVKERQASLGLQAPWGLNQLRNRKKSYIKKGENLSMLARLAQNRPS